MLAQRREAGPTTCGWASSKSTATPAATTTGTLSMTTTTTTTTTRILSMTTTTTTTTRRTTGMQSTWFRTPATPAQTSAGRGGERLFLASAGKSRTQSPRRAPRAQAHRPCVAWPLVDSQAGMHAVGRLTRLRSRWGVPQRGPSPWNRRHGGSRPQVPLTRAPSPRRLPALPSGQGSVAAVAREWQARRRTPGLRRRQPRCASAAGVTASPSAARCQRCAAAAWRGTWLGAATPTHSRRSPASRGRGARRPRGAE
mmetsp:Transcript_5835/g.24546  ORF Transcript_5835/g.24546 Transcript_5835/m.24546 type:complete len:255 (+) Transcript_5835:830-1594(+)